MQNARASGWDSAVIFPPDMMATITIQEQGFGRYTRRGKIHMPKVECGAAFAARRGGQKSRSAIAA